jgi:hypothetical protein
MDLVRPGFEGTPSHRDIVVLTHGQDRPPGRVGERDGRHTIVGAAGQVDDDPLHIRQRGLEGRQRADADRIRPGAADEVGQAARPDQVIREDGDPRRQSNVSAR